MRVGDLMQRNVKSIRSEASVAEAILHSPIRHHSEHQRLSLPARIGARHPKLVGIIEADQHVQAAKRTGVPIDEYMAQRAKTIPLGRPGKAEEFANIACFLASEQGGYITGTATNVDGGTSPAV